MNTVCALDGSWPDAFPAVSVRPETPALHPPSLVDRITGPYRIITRFLERRACSAPPAVPRTLRFMSATVVNGAVTHDLRGHRHSLGLAIGVAVDEAFLAMAMAPSRFPRRAD